jgi:hypothetical protein
MLRAGIRLSHEWLACAELKAKRLVDHKFSCAVCRKQASFNLAPRSQGWPGEATAIFWTLSEASQSRHLYLNNLVNVHEAILDEQLAISRANSNDLDVDIDPRSLALFEPGYDHRPWLAFCAH